MNVLVIGSGGREHALAWKIAQSPLVERVYCAPGNAGTASCATNVSIAADDIDKLLGFASDHRIELTVVGPEAPLVAGIVDRFRERKLKVFGPTAAAARLEGSKIFCKEVLTSAGVPTAAYREFSDARPAMDYLQQVSGPVVVKADGLAAGKGVYVCSGAAEARQAVEAILVQHEFGAAGDRIIIEECLQGEEASFLAFTDGHYVLPLASSQDHKRIGDGDTGKNTGGMGAYSPAPVVTAEVHQRIMDQVMLPTVRRLTEMGVPYQGVLYAGLMIRDGQPQVLEYNVRFGDPETQPLLFRMKSDIVPLLLASIDGTLAHQAIDWDQRPSVCVVVAAQGYPDRYNKGMEIHGLDAPLRDAVVFHAGTKLSEGKVVTSGGRVLGVTAKGANIPAAIDNAYAALAQVSFDQAYWRTDIGRKALKWLE